MRCLKPLFICLFAAAWPACASEREVALLDFDIAPPAMEKVSREPEADPSENLVQSLSAHFEEDRLQRDIQFGTFGRAGRPTKGRAGLAREQSRSIILLPEISDGFGSGVQPRADRDCDGASYAPTWWLSPAAESRRAHHFSMVARIACDHGLPTRLLDAVIAQESGYNPWAISSSGAMGIMQIMPGTARILGLSSPFDAVANMRAGARYLRQQLGRFGRIDLALAAYNAGPERRSLQRGHIPAIPETLNYVRTITTNWARLAALGNDDDVEAADRTFAALLAVRASGYRDVELIRYDGLNASNPM